MSKPRRIRIESIPTNQTDRIVRLELNYNEGGPNYFRGGNTARGYYLSCLLIKQEGEYESYSPMDGFKSLVEETKRFSDKKLNELAVQVKTNPIYETLITSTLDQAGLTKVEEPKELQLTSSQETSFE